MAGDCPALWMLTGIFQSAPLLSCFPLAVNFDWERRRTLSAPLCLDWTLTRGKPICWVQVSMTEVTG
jgi:hypothetical protein